MVDDKADKEREVYCPRSLSAALATFERSGEHVLSKNLREPLGYDSVEKTFRAWRGTLGKRASPYALLGLRKLAIFEHAEAGAMLRFRRSQVKVLKWSRITGRTPAGKSSAALLRRNLDKQLRNSRV